MKKSLFVGIALLSLFIVGCQKTSPNNNISTPTNMDAFATCLTTAGAKMYGTATCPHCLNQKALFGSSFQYVDYVDCLKTPAACSNISRVPTWEFKDGSMIQGELDFVTLSQKTNCPIQ